jgi:hypothetical protein
LGVILMFGGLELAARMHVNHFDKEDRYVMLLTAGVSMWNMGVAYVAGLALWYAFQRDGFKTYDRPASRPHGIHYPMADPMMPSGTERHAPVTWPLSREASRIVR